MTLEELNVWRQLRGAEVKIYGEDIHITRDDGPYHKTTVNEIKVVTVLEFDKRWTFLLELHEDCKKNKSKANDHTS